jgi:hypothetical protein
MTIRSLGILTTDNLPMKERDTSTLSSVEAMIEVYMSANEPQTLRGEYAQGTKTIDSEYKPARLVDVIRTYENLHVEEQYQLKTFSKNMNICLMEH